MLAVWVDDAIIASPTKEGIENVKNGLKQEFKLKEMGEPSRFLGCKVSRDRSKRTITLSQEGYVRKIL
jgi:Reverse transcriptase (RNA-dependent DNA polymerase)